MNDLLSLWYRFASPAGVILDWAGDPAWRERIAALAPGASIQSLPPDSDLADWFASIQQPRIELLRCAAPAALRRAKASFYRNRIDFVSFRADQQIAAFLRYHKLNVVRKAGENYVQIPPTDPIADPAEEWIAIHERFTAPIRPGGAGLIDLPAQLKRYAFDPRGVIHVGVPADAELTQYRQMGFRKILIIEAHPAVHKRFSQKIAGQNDVVAILCALDQSNGMVKLYAPPAGEPPERTTTLPRKNAPEAPWSLMPARSLDHLLSEIGQKIADYNLLRLDIPAGNLRVLQGAPASLKSLDAVITPIQYEPAFENDATVEQIDDFLESLGLERGFTATPIRPAAGEALYIKRPAISMRNLGQWGRFGNQVFEYAFVKILGQEHNLEVQTGAWPGAQLFGCSEPLARKVFPQVLELTYALEQSKVARIAHRPTNLDVCGVFQYHSSYYAPHRDYFQSLFRPVPALQDALDRGMQKIHARGKTLVTLHLRRGDYGYGLFFLAPDPWYLNWLKALWPTLDAPVLYIATDDPAATLPAFAAYQPLIAADLQLPNFGADYYPDFYLLTQSHASAISNSSFSFAACLLNEKANAQANAFMRPDYFAEKLVPFDPWNAEPLLHRELGIIDHRQLRDAINAHRLATGDPKFQALLRDRRAQIAESWSQIRAQQLDKILTQHDLWDCYQLIRGTSIRDLPIVEGERPYIEKAMTALRNTQGRDAIGPYLAATLYHKPAALPPIDPNTLPPSVKDWALR